MSASGMLLFGSRIAVTPIQETETRGGIALPQSSARKSKMETMRGRVVAQSAGYMTDAGAYVELPDVVGKVVHYYSGAVFEVQIKGETYHVIDLTTLLCVED